MAEKQFMRACEAREKVFGTRVAHARVVATSKRPEPQFLKAFQLCIADGFWL